MYVSKEFNYVLHIFVLKLPWWAFWYQKGCLKSWEQIKEIVLPLAHLQSEKLHDYLLYVTGLYIVSL